MIPTRGFYLFRGVPPLQGLPWKVHIPNGNCRETENHIKEIWPMNDEDRKLVDICLVFFPLSIRTRGLPVAFLKIPRATRPPMMWHQLDNSLPCTINRVERQFTEWMKIFISYAYDRGLRSRLYKELND